MFYLYCLCIKPKGAKRKQCKTNKQRCKDVVGQSEGNVTNK